MILVIAEIYCYFDFCNTRLFGYRIPYNFQNKDILKSIPDGAYYPLRFEKEKFKHDKNAIVLLGCSYAFGQYLPDWETLGGILNYKTKRHVYNLAIIGQGAADASMLMDEETISPRINSKVDNVIYVYMFHHLARIMNHRYYAYYRKKGLIENQKHNFLYKSFLYSYFKNRQLEDTLWSDDSYETNKKIFLGLIKNMKTESDRMYGKPKFTFVIYNDENYDINDWIRMNLGNDQKRLDKLFEIMESVEFKKELEDMGIEVITTKELLGRKMSKTEDRIQNDPNRPHPSASAWEEIAPKLIERVKL